MQPLDPEIAAIVNQVSSGAKRAALPPLDPDIIDTINQVFPGEESASTEPAGRPKLDADVLATAEKSIVAHRNNLRDKYAWGLVAPLSGTRLSYAKNALKEVTEPFERQWLVEEVGRIAKMQDWAQRDDWNKSGYLGRLGKLAMQNVNAFAEGGAGMLEAGKGLLGLASGEMRSPEDIKFLRDLEGARNANNPLVAEDASLVEKGLAGASGMIPDAAAGIAATIGGGPAGGFGYWALRQQPELVEGYRAEGLSPGSAALAGTADSGLEAAIELINIDPTGLTNGFVKPLKGAMKRGVVNASEKVGGEALKSLVKHPVTDRVLGTGLGMAKRAGLETLEEGLQGAVQEGGLYLADHAVNENPQRTLGGVLSGAVDQAMQAAPGIAVLGGVGGVAQAGKAVGRFNRFAEGTKHARVQSEIIKAAAEGSVPSRTQWAKWGLPAEEGLSGAKRREVVGRLAENYQTLGQIRAVLSGVTPTESQWVELGLPAEEGKTEGQRKAYLQEKFMAQSAPASVDSQESEEPAEQQSSLEPEEAPEPIAPAAESPKAPTPSRPIEVRGDEFGDGDRKQVRDSAIEWAKENLVFTLANGRKFTNKETGRQIAITNEGIKHTTRMGRTYKLFASIARLPELIENAHFVRSDTPVNMPANTVSVDIFETPMKVGDGDFTATLYVKQTKAGPELYDVYYHHKVQKKGFARPQPQDSYESRAVPAANPSGISIADSGEEVKRQSGQQSLQAAEPVREARGYQPIHHDFPVDMEGTGDRVSAREIVRKIEEIWGVPIRSGRIGSSKPRGIYKLKSEISRLAKGEESSTAVAIHEVIGHHFDNTTNVLKSAPAVAKAELGALDYDQTKRRDFEGFAEFIHAYLTGATETARTGIDLKQATPKFLAYFNGWLDSHPDYKAKMEASRVPMEAYKRAGAIGRVKGQISKTGLDKTNSAPLTKRMHEIAEYLYTRFKDEGRPVSRFTNEAIEHGYDPSVDNRGMKRKIADTTPFEDYNALRQVGPSFAQAAIEDGVFTIAGRTRRKIGPSLKEALKEITEGEDYDNFVAWLYARHAIESWDKNKNPGITLDDAKEVVSRLYDKRYERAADAVTKFNNALIDVLADAGAIDADTADKIKDYYKTYIPLERAKEGAKGSGGRKMVDLSAAVHGRHGSGLQIIDPIESTLARAVRIYERAAKQAVMNKMVKVATDIKGLGKWVEEVPTKIVAEQFSFAKISDQVGAAIQAGMGIDPKDILDSIDPMTALTIWRPDLMKVHGQPIVRVTIDGQPRFFQLHPELAESLGGLDTLRHLDVATKTAKALTGILKMGATRLNPEFIAMNALRDFDTFIMQGEKGLKGAFDPAAWVSAYVVSELKAAKGEAGDPVAKLFHSMGGDLSTWVGLDRKRLKGGVKRVLRGKQDKGETAINIAGASEVGPRLAEFAAILDKEGWLERVKQGQMPPMPVLTRAINAAHDVTVDFRRMGKWGRYINYWVPFFNARLEGTDKFVRTFKDHPTRSAFRAAQWIITRSLIYWWLRHDDDDYKERPEWQDGFYILTDGKGNPIAKIPRSQEWGLIGAGVERMLDAIYDKDHEPLKRWMRQAVGTLNPGELPTGFLLPAETMFNYDMFRNRPIVSASKQKLEAPDQSYDYTSSLMKGVARWFHDTSDGKISLSPAKMDHLANGISGGLYEKANSYGNTAVKVVTGEQIKLNEFPGLKGIMLRKDYPKSVDDFYSAKEAFDKAHESSKLHGKEDVNIDEWRKAGYVSTLMSKMREASRELSDEDKAKTDLAMAGLARAALKREPLKRYPNPLVDPSVVPEKVEIAIEEHIAQKAKTATSKYSDESEAAGVYLVDMGVSSAVARVLVYARLRSNGVHSDTAKKRASKLKW